MTTHSALGSRSMPALFVLLWATGFIGAKFGLPYAGPMTFLAWRMGLATLLLLLVALITRAPWPPSPIAAAHVTVAGLLVHGGYLGGVFSALSHGMTAGMVSLIVGMQPLLTALAARIVLGETLSLRQWSGLLLGLAGLFLVLSHRISFATLSWTSGGLALFALVSISLGTVYQKRFYASVDLRTGGVLQYLASGLCYGVLAWAFETREVVWNATFLLALGWSVLGLSVGAVALLYRLLRRDAASRVASLLYLVPPITALIAFFCFDETLTGLAMGGMLLVALGVALVIA